MAGGRKMWKRGEKYENSSRRSVVGCPQEEAPATQRKILGLNDATYEVPSLRDSAQPLSFCYELMLRANSSLPSSTLSASNTVELETKWPQLQTLPSQHSNHRWKPPKSQKAAAAWPACFPPGCATWLSHWGLWHSSLCSCISR